MLVCTRKRRQAVVIEGFGTAAQMLTVTVLGIHRGRVQLGFEVADEVPIHRRLPAARARGSAALQLHREYT